jgi:hypothetical protein
VNNAIRSFLLLASLVSMAGCGSEGGTANKALDVGGPDATAVAALVEDLNDANTSSKKLDQLFVKGAKPTDLKQFSKCSFYISGKPSVSGSSATCKVRIDDAAGKTLGEPEWSFEKDGAKWKVKAAPMP